jgi:hypothetical protein
MKKKNREYVIIENGIAINFIMTKVISAKVVNCILE